jgi:hypothetical protein
MSENTLFRIHPTIGIARVGNSKDYYLGPETMAGMPSENGDGITGGLPIQKDTDSTTILSKDLRETDTGLLKRQAARFKIFQYDGNDTSYPSGGGTEVKVKDVITVNGEQKTVKNILWSVHLANKKANTWIEPPQGLAAFTPTAECPNQSPEIRNSSFGTLLGAPKPNKCGVPGEEDPVDKICCDATSVLGDTNRLKTLVIDAGPQAIGLGSSAEFTRGATNTYYNPSTKKIEAVSYPQQFPSYPAELDKDEKIDSLGSIETDKEGRLIVLGGFGKATGFDNITGKYDPDRILEEDVNNDGWFDDTADGPVTATLEFTDGTFAAAEGNSWVVTTDPSYAPQIRNVVSLWDDVYNTWIENFSLEDNIYDPAKWTTDNPKDKFNVGIGYNPNYKPDFDNQVLPILEAADLQRWAVNLKTAGVNAHDVISQSTVDNPTRTDLLDFIRNPNDTDPNNTPQNSTRMPLSLGDSEQNFLAISRTQYFFMKQWIDGNAESGTRTLGPGELLDRNILGNCLGGRFSPGIEMTFIVRDPNLYQGFNGTKGSIPAAGPFRINMKTMDYTKVPLSDPFLTVGYVPARSNSPVEPGDICKFMSIPWHTDYNSCATHAASSESNMTYWSWPAQRPVAVYTFDDLACYGNLDFQRFSVRGNGTASPNSVDGTEVLDPYAHVGRYQDNTPNQKPEQGRKEFLKDWDKVGFVIQAPAINEITVDSSKIPAMEVMKDYYLEVESQFIDDESNKVLEAPIPASQYTAPPKGGCPHAAAAAAKDKS